MELLYYKLGNEIRRVCRGQNLTWLKNIHHCVIIDERDNFMKCFKWVKITITLDQSYAAFEYCPHDYIHWYRLLIFLFNDNFTSLNNNYLNHLIFRYFYRFFYIGITSLENLADSIICSSKY